MYSFPSMSLHYTYCVGFIQQLNILLCRKETESSFLPTIHIQTMKQCHQNKMCTREALWVKHRKRARRKMLNKIYILWRKSCTSHGIYKIDSQCNTWQNCMCFLCAKASQQMKQQQVVTTINTKAYMLRNTYATYVSFCLKWFAEYLFQANDQSGLCVHSVLSFYSISISSVPKENLWLCSQFWKSHVALRLPRERVYESAWMRFFFLHLSPLPLCYLCSSFFFFMVLNAFGTLSL